MGSPQKTAFSCREYRRIWPDRMFPAETSSRGTRNRKPHTELVRSARSVALISRLKRTRPSGQEPVAAYRKYDRHKGNIRLGRSEWTLQPPAVCPSKTHGPTSPNFNVGCHLVDPTPLHCAGIINMKASDTSMISVVETIRTSGVKLRSDLIVAYVVGVLQGGVGNRIVGPRDLRSGRRRLNGHL